MIEVLNHYHYDDCFGMPHENIMRPSPLGNPWSHIIRQHMKAIPISSRKEAIQKYFYWLVDCLQNKESAEYIEYKRLWNLYKQYGKLYLECCCVPQDCHGNILKFFLERDLYIE